MSLGAILEVVDDLFHHTNDENGLWGCIVHALQHYHDTRIAVADLNDEGTDAEDAAFYRYIMRYEDECGPCSVPDLPWTNDDEE